VHGLAGDARELSMRRNHHLMESWNFVNDENLFCLFVIIYRLYNGFGAIVIQLLVIYELT
jgi:hypothetical protein